MGKVIHATLAGIASVLTFAPAHADGDSWPENTRSWNVHTISGCKIILNSGSFYLNAAGTREASWDYPNSGVSTRLAYEGPCGANGFANGQGTLRIYSFKAGFTDYYRQYTGDFRNGLLNGTIAAMTFNNQGGSIGYTGQAWDEPPVFSDGCNTEFMEQDWMDASWRESTCRPAEGRALQARLAVAATGSQAPAPVAIAAPAPVGGSAAPAPVGTYAAQLSPARASLSDAIDNAPRGNGQATVETILGALQASLGSGEIAGLLGNDANTVNTILGSVRAALNGDGMALLNGSKREILDTVVGLVDSAISQRQAAAMPASVPVASASSATSAPSSGGYSLSPENLLAAFQRINEPMLLGGPAAAGGQTFTNPQNLFNFYTASCTSGQCAVLEMRACYNYEHASLAKANQWNRGKLFGRASLNAGGLLCLDFNHYEADFMITDAELAGVMQTFRELRELAPAFFNTP